jgi:acetylornithine deacetylase/succinyl-diaminopimelate desuccinylase-like protein
MNNRNALDPVAILQTLIRYDTTNPPGNEAECVGWLDSLLREAGMQTTILARDERRPNLIVRLKGRGLAPPLLLYGHLDVVTTRHQSWEHPPFCGEIIDGCVWGRGALDMKGGVVQMLVAFLRAAEAEPAPAGDVILALLSDEEADGEYGAQFLVEQHPQLFDEVRYAIGEGGGFSQRIGDQKFYTIMVAEKQVCSLQATMSGPAGHGSMPLRGGAMAKLGRVLNRLEGRRLPLHITPTVRQMIETMADALPFPQNLALRQLLNPLWAERILDLMGNQGALISPLLHHTVSPTIVRGGEKINVIPGEITLDLDGRLLPGFAPTNLLDELHRLLGKDVDLQVTRYDPGAGEPDLALYDMLAGILREADPAGIPMPFLLSGVTDGRYFARLGIQTYGFLPADLPDGLITTTHAANERIPVEALHFGADVLHRLLREYGTNE